MFKKWWKRNIFLKKVWTPLFYTNAACGLSTETFYKVLSWIVLFAKLPSMKNTTHYNISRSRMSSHNQVWILLKSLDTSVQHQWGTLSLCGNRFSEFCVCWTIQGRTQGGVGVKTPPWAWYFTKTLLLFANPPTTTHIFCKPSTFCKPSNHYACLRLCSAIVDFIRNNCL